MLANPGSYFLKSIVRSNGVRSTDPEHPVSVVRGRERHCFSNSYVLMITGKLKFLWGSLC